MNDFYIYRNFTVENLFKKRDAAYSGYGDISEIPDAKTYIWFYLPPVKMNQAELFRDIQDFSDKFKLLFSQLGDNICIAFTAEILFNISFENGNPQINQAITDYNNFLYQTAKMHKTLKVIDFSDFVKNASLPLLDWKYYYISQSLISPKLNSEFAIWFDKKWQALQSKRKKCLILDLDNTLWGGILGEDGIEGIQIGDVYPGLAFRDFQESILEASNNGVILAVCSKNNETDVFEVWERHPLVILKQKHFAAYRINWVDKATNIQELAEELSIGLDSIVFLDDNPAERARVQQTLPEVAVPDFPEQPHQLTLFFKTIYATYFQIHQLTREDKSKTDQYIANTERNVFKKEFTDIDAYLESLDIQLEIFAADKFNFARIAQMTQKTNQFNVTTRRYTENDIRQFLAEKNIVVCLGVKDKFGDNGITAAIIIRIDETEAEIDSFLLSCRILGRGIETAFIDYLLNDLFSRGVRHVKAIFIPTSKNKQAENFFEKNGFELLSKDENGVRQYEIYLKTYREIKKYYAFKIAQHA